MNSAPVPADSASAAERRRASFSRLVTLGGVLGLVATTGVFVVGRLALHATSDRAEHAEAARSAARAQALLDRRARVHQLVAEEYGFWTDTWDYMQAPRAPGAAQFVRDNFVEWHPVRYGVRFMALLGRDGRPTFLWKDSTAAGIDTVLLRPALLARLDRDASVGGYVATPRGLYLLSAALITTTDAPGSTAAHAGYFVMGTPVGDSLPTLSAELQEALRLLPVDAGLTAESLRVTHHGDSTEAAFALHGVYGDAVAGIAVRRQQVLAAGVRRSLNAMLLGALIVGGALIGAGWFFARRWVVRPTMRIVRALEQMEQDGRLGPIDEQPFTREWARLLGAFNTTVHALRQSEERLRQAQKLEAIGTLSSGVAHDFNNQLAVVLSSASFVRESLGAGHEAAPYVDDIEQAARRSAELTRQLLSFTRKDHLRFGVVRLDELAERVRALCERTFDRAIRIESHLQPVTVQGDAGQLEQVLLNLCINARDAMPGGGTLTVASDVRFVSAPDALTLGLAGPGRYAHVTVTDTGVGIPPEVLPRIFEPFFSTKGAGQGSGLGLSLVYGTMRGHEGAVTVRSERGAGSRFELYLPAAEVDAEGHTPVPGQAALPRGTERILLVDDESGLRRAVARALRQLGYVVDEAENGRVGVDLFAADPGVYDLVILDMVMPEMGGAEAYERIREFRTDLPVLVISGYSAEGVLQQLLAKGARSALAKPFDIQTLARRVRTLLDAEATGPGVLTKLGTMLML